MNAPEGAMCSTHPEVKALGACSRCGTFFCTQCTNDFERCLRCPAVPVLADVGIRFVANLVDSVVFMAPMFMAGLVAFLIAHSFETGEPEDIPGSVGIAIGVAMLAAVVGLGVQLFFQIKFGRSLAKWLFGLRVVRTDGSPADIWRIIFLRNIAIHVLSNLCGLVGLVDPLLIFGEKRKCLHDYLADTIVVVDPREPL